MTVAGRPSTAKASLDSSSDCTTGVAAQQRIVRADAAPLSIYSPPSVDFCEARLAIAISSAPPSGVTSVTQVGRVRDTVHRTATPVGDRAFAKGAKGTP